MTTHLHSSMQSQIEIVPLKSIPVAGLIQNASSMSIKSPRLEREQTERDVLQTSEHEESETELQFEQIRDA